LRGSDPNGEIETEANINGSGKRSGAKGKVVEVDIAAVEATLLRIEPQVSGADFELLKRLVATLTFVMRFLHAQRSTIARLRRFLGLQSSEKTAEVLGKGQDVPSEGEGCEPAAGGAPIDEGSNRDQEPQKAKGHGRTPASDYKEAKHFAVSHESLKPGVPCPGCGCGKLFDLNEPAQFLRIVGQPVLQALCWDCQRLRCSGCGHVYTACAPKEAQGPKFDETAVSMIALCRYSVGVPLNRLENLQRNLKTPVPSSTQWDVLDQSAPTFQPVFDEMEKQAAQGKVVHDDDTYVRILSLMGKRRAELLKRGELPDPERKGLFTTAIVSIKDDAPIALFYTGRKYAGENLADLLQARDADLDAPILMSDGLASRNLPKGHAVVESNCAAHARRGVVDQIPNFPADCTFVLEELRKIFVVEARCKKAGLSPEERLALHQRESGPVLSALERWMTHEIEAKRVEPNSGLGRAYNYMLKRWDKLTLFLRIPGAPIDNNLCERVLKKAICHRRNSLFYRSQHGAKVGDIFMSLIHTAELRGQNPFDYLTAVQRHAKAAADSPADWLPWTYRETLARLAEDPTLAGKAPQIPHSSSARPSAVRAFDSPPPSP
jgi:hypothetical protein